MFYDGKFAAGNPKAFGQPLKSLAKNTAQASQPPGKIHRRVSRLISTPIRRERDRSTGLETTAPHQQS
jgi:hypothetical protein